MKWKISINWKKVKVFLIGGEIGFIVPIPRMRSDARIKENLGAADIELCDAEYRELTDALNKLKVHGNRDGKDIKKLGTVPDNVDK